MIRRHSRSAIFMHWFNAICWIFLLFSGFALLQLLLAVSYAFSYAVGAFLALTLITAYIA